MIFRFNLGIFVIIVKLAFAASSNLTCNQNDDFYFTTPNSNCNQFYRCSDNKKLTYQCSHDKQFDFDSQGCVASNEANPCNDPSCDEKYDGLYADESQGCQRFYRCNGNQIIKLESCKRGFLFNGVSCEIAENVKCASKLTKRSCHSSIKSIASTQECQHLPDGLYADTSKDCRGYLKCSNGKTIQQRCPSTSVFNPIQGSCTPNVLYECPYSARLEKLCKGKSDGYHPDPRYGCNAFVKCQRGAAVQFDECVKGQTFDRKFCVHKAATLCQHETQSTECLNLEMGYYQDRSIESSCRNYFFCFNGRKTTFSCPVGELFNGESCVDDRLYTCPNLDADSCDTKEDGYYKDVGLDCRSYFLCSSKRKISLLCKRGEAFDGNKCVSKRHVEQLCPKSSECIGRPDGYYQDPKSGCTKYYYCKQSEKLQVLTCRNGKLFNGNNCVTPQSYTCPKGQNNLAKVNCVTRKCLPTMCLKEDGFFADYDSKCKNYYFCVNGIQTKLSCQKNFIFNENEGLCVPLGKYQCPVNCSNECV